MNKFFSAAAFAAAASAAALGRRDMGSSCGFQIQSSGGVDAIMGQFEDGQNRLNGSYPTATYYFSNGGITDQAGRPCIVTTTNDATHQFQCDENSPGGPTLGFSIASNGSILFNGNDQFYACPYITEYNIYTQWLQGQDKCRPIKLSTNSTCAVGSGGGSPSPSGYSPRVPGYSAGSSAPPYPVSSATVQQSVPGTAVVPGYSKSSPVSPVEETPAVLGYGESSAVASTSTVPVVPGYGPETSVPAVETSAPVYSTSVETTIESQTVPGYAPSFESSVPVASVETPPASIPAYPVASSSPVESSPVESTGIESYGTPAVSTPVPSSPTGPAGVTITQTVYTSDCETATTEVISGTTVTSVGTTQSYITSVYSQSVPQETPSSPASVPEYSAPSMPGYGITTPVESSPVESATTSQPVPTSAPQQSVPHPAPSSSSSKPVESSPVESTSAISSSAPVPSYPAQGPSTAPVPTSSQETTCTDSITVVSPSVPAETVPAPSVTASCAPAGSTDSQGRYSCNPAHQYPAGQTCAFENGCYYLSTSSSMASSTVPTAPVSVPATSEIFETTTCTGSVSSAPSTTFATSSVPSAVYSKPSSSASFNTKPAGYQSSSGSTSAVSSAPSGVTAATSTTATATACQTSLTDAYQTPHLINWISKDYPSQSYGSQLNATINEDCSTLFTFDIPADYAGKQCSVIFLFPKQEDLETSAWSWNEQGSIEFSQLSGAATEETTYDTCPSKQSTLDTVAIEAGNSYVVSTGACQAGEAVTVEASSVDGLGLEFFEDWNPSSLGVYITAC